MESHISSVSKRDDEVALGLHHDLNNNPSRATAKIFALQNTSSLKTPDRKPKLVLVNYRAALLQTPESMTSIFTGEGQVMLDVQSPKNPSPEIPDESRSNRNSHRMALRSISSWLRNGSGSDNAAPVSNPDPQAIRSPQGNSVKRKLDAIDTLDASNGDSAQAVITDSERINEGEFTNASELGPPRKRRTSVKRPTGYVKYRQSMQDDKPEPFGEPPVWADKRQNLCEALPYYKAYMSGAYMHDGLVSAFLVDKEVGPRDKFDEEVIITRVGGGRKPDAQTGRMVHTTNQDTSAVALGFQRAKDGHHPIAMIAGQGNTICPSKLPHYYNVLDWFQVTDVWCEKHAGLKCWMVKVEKICLFNKSWWAPIKSPLPDPNRNIHAFQAISQYCNVCHKISKQIFRQGWTCLEPLCHQYFKFAPEIRDEDLDYSEEFMKERTDFLDMALPPLAPPLLTARDADEMGAFGCELLFKHGIVCPLCKGCSRRIEWRQWTCETPGCAFTHKIRQDAMSVRDAISTGYFANSKELCNETFGIRHGIKTIGLYDIDEFVIPGPGKDKVAGIIKHFKASDAINAQLNGPNQLFYQMQQDEFGLKRYPARQKGTIGEVLTSHWAANWGAPYKYGVSVLSKGFDEAPSAIIKALKRLTWAGEQTSTEDLESFHPFNELLSIGYFEDTAIGYHDDGEKELGPTVATLSLGGDAIMSLRPKAKSGLGPGSRNAKGTKLDVLRFKIRHGDIVIMNGSGIQKLYEHAVTPHGKLRFALTCRYVRPELMADDEERRQAEIKARLPDGHEEYSYDGETESQVLQAGSESAHVPAVQRVVDDLLARIHSGELDFDGMQQYRSRVNSLVDSMLAPRSATNDVPMEDVE